MTKPELVFASHNPGKVQEMHELLGYHYHIRTLNELGIVQDIEETGATLDENALLKARFIHSITGLDCFADDTGLEVEALGGRPGVYSARYAGPQKSDADNIALLLQELDGHHHRTACFRTVIALIKNGQSYIFDGTIQGHIGTVKLGENGFGYDPVFIPEHEVLTFAQMTSVQKNAMSHRAVAMKKLAQFLHKEATR